MERVKKFLLINLRWILLPLTLAVLIPAFPGVLGPQNWMELLRVSAPVAVAITGMSFIQSGGWVDISCGCQIALSSALMVRCGLGGWSLWMALIVCILVGLLCGAANGLLIWRLGFAPTAAVISMMFVTYGLASLAEAHNAADGGTAAFSAAAFGTPIALLIMLLCLIVGYLLFNQTFVGRYLLAVKEDENAVRMSGANTGLVAFSGFVIGALFFGVAAFLDTGIRGAVPVTQSVEYDALVILGTHLSGASSSARRSIGHNFSMICTILSALVLVSIQRVTDAFGLNSAIAYVIFGVVLMIELYFGRSSHRFSLHK